MYPLSIITVTGLIFGLYFIFALTQLRKFESVYTRSLWIVSLVILGIFLVLNILYAQPGVQPNSEGYTFIQSYVHFDIEGTLSNTYSAILLFCVSIVSFLLILFSRPSQRLDMRYWLWLVIGILFSVVAYDEYFNPPNLHGQQFALYGYVLSGVISVLCLLYILLRMSVEHKWRYLWMLGGLGLIGTGGVLLDNQLLFNISTSDVALLEEVLEILGIITVLIVGLSFLRNKAPKALWTIAKPLLFLAIIWVEILFLASPNLRNTYDYYIDDVTTDGTIYGDNAIELIGYSFSPSLVNAGDTITGNLYFRANRKLSEDYSFSAHLLSVPDAVSVAQQDNENVGNGLTRTWIPEMIVKQAISITVPAGINRPATYSLAIRLWSSDENFIESGNFDDWQAQTQGLAIQSTSNRLIGEDFIALQNFVVLSDEAPSSIQGDTVAFNNGIQLVIGSIDEMVFSSGDDVTFTFQWASYEPIAVDWQQILHFQHQDTGELFVFDRPPFSGRLPSSSWDNGFLANDTVSINIPADMPSGTYQILTGLYDPETVQRLAVNGDYQDNIIVVNTITIE